MSNPYYEKLLETNRLLNLTSNSFCLAKWKQVTLHLETGMTHSCHHPVPHLVPLEELKDNPAALFNTAVLKKCRSEMLDGVRPKECDYCWNIEDAPGNNFSDRTLKSNEEWALPDLQEIAKSDPSDNAIPSYLELSFSSKCNFKCSYCNPSVSSFWFDEVSKHGEYKLDYENYNSPAFFSHIYEEENNPYIDAFWKWFPAIFDKLKIIRITGGEPLLSSNVFLMLDFFIQNPCPDLEINVNTNLGIPRNILDKFIEKIKTLEEKKYLKRIVVFTSIEGWGEQAEYIRYPLSFDTFWRNVNLVLSSTSTTIVSIMSTLNALSLPSLKALIENVYDLKQKTSTKDWMRVYIDFSYLRYPKHQIIQVLPPVFHHYLDECYEYLIQKKQTDIHFGFHEFEVIKLKRIIDYSKVPLEDVDKLKLENSFVQFLEEHDRRRKTDYQKCFPEYSEFFKQIKERLSNVK